MKTIRSISLRFVILIALALGIFHSSSEASQVDDPVYVRLSFQASFFGTSPPYGGSMYVSLIDETGSAVYSYIYAAPAYQWTTGASVTAKLYPNKNYSVSISTSGGYGTVVWEPVDEAARTQVLIEGVERYKQSIGSGQSVAQTVRVSTLQRSSAASIAPGAKNVPIMIADPAPLSPKPEPADIGRTDLGAGQPSSISDDKPIW